MTQHASRRELLGVETHLLGLSGLIAVASMVFIWQNQDPLAVSIPEVSIPLVVALGLGTYTFWLQQQELPSERTCQMVKYGWSGAVLAGAIGGFWLALHLYSGLPIDILPDKILTVASISIAAGILVGRSKYESGSETRATDRETVLFETRWTDQPDAMPIVVAVLEAVAEVEAVDPLELEPLSEHIDLDNLSEVRTQNDSRWKFTFYAYGYEIRVSSAGTVTIYQSDLDDDAFPSISP